MVCLYYHHIIAIPINVSDKIQLPQASHSGYPIVPSLELDTLPHWDTINAPSLSTPAPWLLSSSSLRLSLGTAEPRDSRVRRREEWQTRSWETSLPNEETASLSNKCILIPFTYILKHSCHTILYKLWKESEAKVKVAQSCPTLCDPMDYTVHGILQARILEWIAFPFSRASSQPRDRTQVSCIAGGFFTSWSTREAQE